MQGATTVICDIWFRYRKISDIKCIPGNLCELFKNRYEIFKGINYRNKTPTLFPYSSLYYFDELFTVSTTIFYRSVQTRRLRKLKICKEKLVVKLTIIHDCFPIANFEIRIPRFWNCFVLSVHLVSELPKLIDLVPNQESMESFFKVFR